MAEKKKTDQNPDILEKLSPEELQERIQEEKKNAKRSLRFVFTALVAIIAVCIAWFVANNRVAMTGAQVSAENDAPFKIASVGKRQSGEEQYFKDENNNNILSDTTTETYSSYIDAETGKTISTGEKTYYTGGSGIAWHMNSEQSLVPGAGGKLEFYLIPKKSGLTKADISLNLEGYKLAGEDDNKKVQKVGNEKIQSLINGHILLFQHVDDTYGYYDWLGENQTFTVSAPGGENAVFTPGTPYKVTLYWKWPQYFRNYIYTQRSTYGDLFTDEMLKKYKTEYDTMIAFVNKQNKISNSKLFYDESSTAPDIAEGAIKNTMPDDILNTCNKYYNQADEYIGNNTDYIYIQINVN